MKIRVFESFAGYGSQGSASIKLLGNEHDKVEGLTE
jgi:hypothetical protein